jgi:hypothetical protein
MQALRMEIGADSLMLEPARYSLRVLASQGQPGRSHTPEDSLSFYPLLHLFHRWQVRMPLASFDHN